MSFESLVKKLMKEGKSKTAATKIAGSVANAKMKGAGSGPTAKQKARAKSPATKKDKPRAVIRDKDRVADKSRSYTDKKGRKIEIKTFNYEKKYDSGVKDDPNKPSMKRKSSRLSNTVELHKTKTKKDGTTKTKVKRAAGGGKKSQRLHTKFAKGKNKEGSSDVTITRKSPTTMKKSPTKMKSPAKKPLVGGQKKLPKELQEAILKAPAKMLSKSGIKMMDKSPTTMKKQKTKSNDVHGNVTKTTIKGNKKKEVTRVKKEYASNAKPLSENPTVKRKSKKRYVKKTTYASNAQPLQENPSKVKTRGNAPIKKSKQKVEQDYARNAIADYKSGKTKEAKYEKKKALEVAAGESPAKMKKPVTKKKTTVDGTKVKEKLKKGTIKVKIKSPSGSKRKFAMSTNSKSIDDSFRVNDPQKYKNRRDARKANAPSMMKTNQSGGGYAAKNPAAPARQLKKLGSVLSKHFKSNM